jgi:hypothetical protein
MDARANPPSDHADVPKSSVGIYRKPHSGTHESVAALVGVQPEFRISLKIGDHGLAGGTIWPMREKFALDGFEVQPFQGGCRIGSANRETVRDVGMTKQLRSAKSLGAPSCYWSMSLTSEVGESRRTDAVARQLGAAPRCEIPNSGGSSPERPARSLCLLGMKRPAGVLSLRQILQRPRLACLCCIKNEHNA